MGLDLGILEVFSNLNDSMVLGVDTGITGLGHTVTASLHLNEVFQAQNYRIIESFRLEKTPRIINPSPSPPCSLTMSFSVTSPQFFLEL